ncbi:hypothetical protein BGP78_08385 [Pseudoalteromonas sp. MSK9-3]|uniref:hypothetical protein n=1 Tax=Pseudoalteromonas sp. MSK9-3 TaxID=1897633 RepID=UPI000E6BCCEE|nr:hypothetical protein [Pseudoalteromonas sp. MSK9-3]RJE77357.1 hypothetical protein BGP78_08385 [Pseudoalteromonas sp. MSK9-3]
MRGIVCSITILLLGGCISTPMLTSSNNTPTQSLSELIEDTSCSASFQCKVLSVGERAACGGPSQYLVYSNKSVDEEQVEKLAEQVTVKERIINQEQAQVDVCKQVLPIQALCINNQCKAFTIK